MVVSMLYQALKKMFLSSNNIVHKLYIKELHFLSQMLGFFNPKP